MTNKAPIKFASGATIGPVTIICTTVLALAMIGCFLVLALYGKVETVRAWLIPLIPVLATAASAFLLWAKAHSVQTHATAATDNVGAQVADTLNGELDAKIINSVHAAVQDDQFKHAVRAALTEPTGQTIKKGI